LGGDFSPAISWYFLHFVFMSFVRIMREWCLCGVLGVSLLCHRAHATGLRENTHYGWAKTLWF
jgi:hypothetical protein